MSVRRFPMPKWPNRGDGWCTWCGEAVERPRRTWHEDCLNRYKLHAYPDVQKAHVALRDGERCWDCGCLPTHWKKGANAIGCIRVGHPDYVGPYCTLERVYALELEHEVPLWRVAHLPDDERRRYFGPDNLRLRCPDCHKAKSRREAAERAAMKAANQNIPSPDRIAS